MAIRRARPRAAVSRPPRLGRPRTVSPARSRSRAGINWPAVTSLITALTAVGALVFTALSLNATRDQVSISEQGQFTDRYTKAVEQLDKAGADHLQARLGALYALERLAHDSPRDQPTIVEVLSAFIRTTAPSIFAKEGCPAVLPAADVQAALTILGRRDTAHDNTARVDLSRACLAGASLADAHLADANLASTDLSQSDLRGADLSRAAISHVNLSHSLLTGARLRDAKGEEPDFHWSVLAEADLTGVGLDQANFNLADLARANLTGATLRAANFDIAHLVSANLTRAYLVGAKLTRIYVTDADFTGVVHDDTTVVTTASPDDKPAKGKWW